MCQPDIYLLDIQSGILFVIFQLETNLKFSRRLIWLSILSFCLTCQRPAV